MPKVDTTVGNYTIQLPAYLWDFLNERAKEVNFLPGSYLSAILFNELQNPLSPRNILHLLIAERLYPRFEEKDINQLLDIIDDETMQIINLLPDDDEVDAPQ